MLNNKNKAYTLFEILLTVCILAILITLIIPTLFQSNSVDAKKLHAVTTNFYQGVENATVWLNSPKKLKDSDEDGEITAIDFRDYFFEKLDGDQNDVSCSFFEGHLAQALQIPKEKDEDESKDEEAEDISAKLSCADFRSNITAGFYYEPKCNLTVVSKEYYTITEQGDEEELPRTVKNACGVIVYATQDSMKFVQKQEDAQVGKNIFTIAIGDGYVKK